MVFLPKVSLLFRAFVYIVAAALASFVSQISLAPVYGGIPSSLHHNSICATIFFATWVSKDWVRARSLSSLVPVLMFFIPGILNHIFRYSDRFGPIYGPIITEAITFYPVLFVNVLRAARILSFGNIMFNVIPAGISYGIFTVAQSTIPAVLHNYIGSSWFMTRCGLMNMLGIVYALLSPSMLLLATIPSLIHSGFINTMCVTTPALNATLAHSNYSLIARHESNTGYVAVLDNFAEGYRVLRCDHSLLGGEWQRPPKGLEHQITGRFREPIYSVFILLEAVRLAVPAPKNPQTRALSIGLGIGTSADALIRHGVDVDIVELDPAVYRYAQEYFGLSKNHTAFIEDAVSFVKRESRKPATEKRRYDYVIHDVFTGGAVPASLFTLEVLDGLKEIMADDGVIAINWAGDLKLQAAQSIVMTIKSVFNNCRAFREDDPDNNADKNADFANMVIFCNKQQPSGGIVFRDATEEDFLGSYSRRGYLDPRYEVHLGSGDGAHGVLFAEDNVRQTLEVWQRKSATGHWTLIRTVIPARVWECY